MKFYVSADIEGTTGISNWKETEKGTGEYTPIQKQMSREVGTLTHGINRGCQGTGDFIEEVEILVRDAHDSANNLDINKLSENSLYLKEWSGNWMSMMSGIDSSFDGVFFSGYHSGAHSDKNPLAHTMSGDIQSFKINGEDVSEFHLNAYIANHYSVPVLMITGDEGIIEEAKRLIPNIQGVALIKGFGNSTISIHPNLATKLIEEGGADVVKLLKTHGKEHFLFKQPESFTFEIEFKAHRFANRASYYPGVERVGAKSIKFTGKTIEEAMITYMFIR